MQEGSSRVVGEGGGVIALVLEIVALFAVVMFTIMIVQGVRKVPVHMQSVLWVTDNSEE